MKAKLYIYIYIKKRERLIEMLFDILKSFCPNYSIVKFMIFIKNYFSI